MYTNHSVQMNCNDETLLNDVLEHPISNHTSLVFIDKKVSKQSNNVYLCRNKGEHALLKTDNLLHDEPNYTNGTNANFKKDTSLTDENIRKEQFNYIINNACKNNCTYKINNQIHKLIHEKLTSSEIKHNEKATYCRPIINLYNEQFIFKTMERNARLKELIKKMAMARQREKVKVAWNNFINMLKNKHAVNDSNYIGDINECNDVKWSPNKRSTLCKELLEKFYDDKYFYSKQLSHNKDEQTGKDYNLFKYGEDLFCYPTSSQARLIMLGREQREYQYRGNWGDHASDRNLCNRKRALTDNEKYPFNLNIRKTCSVQTNLKSLGNFTQNMYRDKATNAVEELDKKNTNIMQIENDKYINKVSLQKVGDRLVTLIDSINTFIDEIKISKTSMKQNALKPNICSCREEKCLNIKDAITRTDIEKVNRETEVSSCEVPNNDDTVKKVSSNSYQIEFEVPTKDYSTEITKSFLNDLPKIADQNIEDIKTIKHNDSLYEPITIAVNTDPLSFLALLRLSTDTLKGVLSCLPILNNYQYLLSLPARYNENDTRYVCNICGAGFNKPSELNDHIFEHNLGITRDCCVCRYVLDNVERQVSVFRCKYCGKCFTRAYCFELHQNACAKQRGQDQDESSDLLLLR